jgi:alpha-L-fucosidase
MEFYGFIHFTLNTWTDKEWGYGDENPSLFNPTQLDCRQWAETAKSAGMTGMILTTKHHDGFCLWPSKYTEHSVKNSPWKNGNGDVLMEFVDACREFGIKPGFYLSPWDRNHKDYGRPEYVTYYRNQLTEILSNYGELFEVWFDGANGGDGFYGGARETRTIDRTKYYGWKENFEIVRRLQPKACMFSDAGPDIRWVGNEKGFVSTETSWMTFDSEDRYPGFTGFADLSILSNGERNGKNWVPPECDVSIRPGWFYHDAENDKVKPPEELVELYFNSIGRGGNFLLNLPPDRRGLVHENDVTSLAGMKKNLDAIFKTDLAIGKKTKASNVRGNSAKFAGDKTVDGKRNTYWSTDDSVLDAELVVDLGRTSTFNVIKLREFIPLGQRVEAFAVDCWQDGNWVEIAKGTSIGSQRLFKIETVSSGKIRLRIIESSASPCISEILLLKW